MKFTVPTTSLLAFNCPHCEAFAKQFWFEANASSLAKDSTPSIAIPRQTYLLSSVELQDSASREAFVKSASSAAQGLPFFEKNQQNVDIKVGNVSYSQCYNCNEISIWINDRMVYPNCGTAPLPNPDMSLQIRKDYSEASAIADVSPRGAAALLRLCIEKLCIELGQKGRNLNEDIGALVKNGLDPRVQRALDTVRVIGNNYVHPGKMDLGDDRATVNTLFTLLNLIIEKTISEPNHVTEMYDSLPSSVLTAIEKRDGG